MRTRKKRAPEHYNNIQLFYIQSRIVLTISGSERLFASFALYSPRLSFRASLPPQYEAEFSRRRYVLYCLIKMRFQQTEIY